MDEIEQQNLTRRDYVSELLELIRSNIPPESLKEKLEDYHESDIAEVVGELNKEERLKLYKVLGDEITSEVFAHLDNVEDFVEELSSEKVADILEEMDADDAVDVLDELDEDKRQEIIELLDEETAQDIKLLDAYDDDVIGSHMTTNFITIDRSLTIKGAMKSVVDKAAENDNISTIYAVNSDGTYYGAISLRDLVVARATSSLDDIISTAYPYLYATEPVDSCLEKLKDYSEDSIPLLNDQNNVVGVITSYKLADVASEEMEEDYAKLAGLSAQEDLQEPLRLSIKKRLPWLITLMLLGLVVSSLIGSFSYVITLLPILAVFQSLLLDMGGNTGTQSLAVTIRIISGEPLKRKERNRLIFKEFRVGLVNGLIIGTVATALCSLYIYFIAGNAYGVTTFFRSLQIGGCIGFSLCTAMACASLSGTLIPILFKKIKVDPAVASGPLLTTINDIIAASVYYSLAWLILIKIFGL